jgi:hypothetical protein
MEDRRQKLYPRRHNYQQIEDISKKIDLFVTSRRKERKQKLYPRRRNYQKIEDI